MADPRITAAFEMTEHGPKPRSANLSPLMKALGKASLGEVVNFCKVAGAVGGWNPCEDSELDTNGHCRHLIGFTNATESECKSGRATYEPMVKRNGRRVVQVERDLVRINPHEEPAEYEAGPPKLPRVHRDDVIVQITCSSRVYRDVDKRPVKAPAETAA